MTTIYLIRHAQSRPDPGQAEADWPLSDVGTGQARGLVPILHSLRLQRLYSSPFRRCRDTLDPFADESGLALQFDDGLRERRIAGAWMQNFRDVWQRSWEDFSFALDGGESSWTCRTRMAGAVESIARRHAGETIGLGSHGNAIALFLHYADASVGIKEARALRTPEIVKVVHAEGRFTWDRSFTAGEALTRLATDFRETPGIVA
ncbi:MAG: histidine phosphatase family protein [Opitutaceae bacterium]|nr:histidine phosphatase family protein [Opitutaceae bacterium]